MDIIEEETKEFIRRLPEITLRPASAHLIMLAARSRIFKQIYKTKIQDIVVERKIVRPRPQHGNWRDEYFKNVCNFSTLQTQGTYYYRKEEFPEPLKIPNNGLALFATIIPRNVAKASVDMMKFIADHLYQSTTDDMACNSLARIDVEFFSALHSSRLQHDLKLKTVDIENEEVYKPIMDYLTSYKIWMVLKTSRGYHTILDLSNKQDASDFHGGGGTWEKIDAMYGAKKFGKDAQVELLRDNQSPIPGCLYYNPNKIDIKNYVKIIQ